MRTIVLSLLALALFNGPRARAQQVFATTSHQYTSHDVAIPAGALGTSVHGWVQFPPGDPGLLGVGGDTTAANDRSYFTLDGYGTPAISFFVNWGLRIRTN